MKKIILVLIPFLFCLAFAGNAQPLTPAEKEVPYIEVTGTAEKEVVPDEIFISISLKERQDGKEKHSIEQQESAMKQGLTSIGIDLKDLSLSDATSDYVRVKIAKRDVISTSDYLLKVNNAATLGKVFEKLDELKIEDAKIARVSHSRIEEFRKEVKILAIKAAKDKADYLLNAIGEKTGKPLVIMENRPDIYTTANAQVSQQYELQNIYKAEGISAKAFPELQFQKIKIASTFYVKFAIQ